MSNQPKKTLEGLLQGIQSRGTAAPRPRAVVGPRRPGGRPPGKSSDPEFKQITGLIRKDLHAAVLIAMLEQGRPRDLGPLLAELLGAWLKQHQKKKHDDMS